MLRLTDWHGLPHGCMQQEKKGRTNSDIIPLSVLNVSLQINTQFTFSGFFLSDELQRNMTNKCLVLTSFQ